MSGVAAHMGSRETGLFSDVMDKQKPGLHMVLKVFPINSQLDLVHDVPSPQDTRKNFGSQQPDSRVFSID